MTVTTLQNTIMRTPRRWSLRGSIRNQILIPIVGIQVLAVTAVTLAMATLAAARGEREIVARLNGVVDALGHANFPYTASVLDRMRSLSGAHFAVLDDDGRVAETTLPGLQNHPLALANIRPRDRLVSLGDSTTLALKGARYFALPLRTTTGGARDSTLLVLYPETSWRQAKWEAAAPPLAVGLGTLVLLAAVTSWTAHRIGARIRDVQRQVARIADGHFQGFEPGTRRDEVHDLAVSVNLMSSQLKQMSQTIGQSERTRLIGQLAAGLAHQLRNALTGARLSVQLHAPTLPPRPGDETLDVALRQLAMTEQQVKGLLALGRVERQPHAPCDVGRLLDEVAALVGPTCLHARVDFRHSIEAVPRTILGDASGLRGAILNVLLNAVEAAGPGGRVSLDARADADGLLIAVTDDGPGPSPDLASTLLDPFVTSKPEGVGLGLAIARQVAAEHGGRLSWVRDGAFTRFQIALPTEAA